MIDEIWNERFRKLTVHCLQCDGIFREAKPIIKTCPHCGNAEMTKTVYFQEEES